MITLMRWRIATRKGAPVDTARAVTLARISSFQLGIVLSMVFLATAIARGLGF